MTPRAGYYSRASDQQPGDTHREVTPQHDSPHGTVVPFSSDNATSLSLIMMGDGRRLTSLLVGGPGRLRPPPGLSSPAHCTRAAIARAQSRASVCVVSTCTS